MKRIVFLFLLFPQIVLAQYNEDIFALNSKDVPVEQKNVSVTIQKDTVIDIGIKDRIYGLSVTGDAILNNSTDSYVRVVLRDDHNREFLAYECFPLLTETLKPRFRNIALETNTLDGITAHSIRVELKKASLNIDYIEYIPETEAAKQLLGKAAVVQKEQTRQIANLMNRNLAKRNMTWRAAVTSMSVKSFDEKKEMFGGTMPQLYGFDYYSGGVFVFPSSDEPSVRSLANSDSLVSYVREWDWRNRHGKNWMTSVKDQKWCNSCWIFAAIGALEAYINLYYNQTATYINSSNEQVMGYNLSEQEIMNCIEGNNCGSRGYPGKALKYIMVNGVVNDECFPYFANNSDCSDKCAVPAERVNIESYDSISSFVQDEVIKTNLFRAPLTFTITTWLHALVLVGYKTLAVGDVVRINKDSTVTITETIHQNLIGKNAWLFKNSWGPDWGEENGYAYVVLDRWNRLSMFALDGQITCLQHTDNDIVCEDADGDGYYFWGVNDNKPLFCPYWVPDVKDGNDADYTKGELLLENTPVIGELETLNPNGNSSLVISGNTTYTTRQSIYSHIRIVSGGKLTVKDILNLFGRVTVTIESGGELVIDGGVVTNADISFALGGKITLKNGGKLVVRTGTDFCVPQGALADIKEGEILRSNDF